MANLYGKYLLDASKNYKQSGFDGKFEDYFTDYLFENLNYNDDVGNCILDFVEEKVLHKDHVLTDDNISSDLMKFKEVLISLNAIDNSYDVGELIGYILLGNILNAKE